MKQRAHAWVALRALKLIEDTKAAPELVELLCFYLSDVWDGAWIPDSLLVDMSYGHIFKMDTDCALLGKDISKEDWLRVPYGDLKNKLKGNRQCLELVKDEPVLNVPYESLEEKGGHLPDRVLALSHSIGDMLKMADYPLAFYARKKTPKAYQADLSAQSVKDLSGSPNYSARQIAQAFFIMSHYITDAHMPLHCDLRDYGGDGQPTRRLPDKLHASIEEEWEKHFPVKETLALHRYSDVSLDRVTTALPSGSIIGMDAGDSLFVNGLNEWTELVLICRVSFALSRQWIQGMPKNACALIASRGADDFARVTNAIFHDAVCSVAAQWVKAWRKFTQ